MEIKDVDILRAYARILVTSTWGQDQWQYFETIIQKESEWIHHKEHNSSLSSAYGLGGFLDSTWSSVNCEKTDDRIEQIRCTVIYIQNRYGNPKRALDHHLQNNWY